MAEDGTRLRSCPVAIFVISGDDSGIQLLWKSVSSSAVQCVTAFVGGPVQVSLYCDLLRAGRSGDRISVGARFSVPVQTGRGSTISTGFFPGLKRPRRGADYLRHMAPRLKKESSYISTPPWVFLAHSGVNFTFTLPP